MGWPPDNPLKAKKKNNPGNYKIPRVPKHKQRLKHFIANVFDKDRPLIKKKKEDPVMISVPPTTVEQELGIETTPKTPKVKKEKEPKDKTRYKWEKAYNTDGKPRGKRKGPKVDESLSWDEQGPMVEKWKIRGRGKQSDPKAYPGVKKIRSTHTNYQDPEGEKGEMNRKHESVTKYKRSSAGYSGLVREVGDKKIRTDFPTRKELKAHNKWAKEEGLEGVGPAIRKTKAVNDVFGTGDNYVKTWYRGKLKPTIKHF